MFQLNFSVEHFSWSRHGPLRLWGVKNPNTNYWKYNAGLSVGGGVCQPMRGGQWLMRANGKVWRGHVAVRLTGEVTNVGCAPAWGHTTVRQIFGSRSPDISNRRILLLLQSVEGVVDIISTLLLLQWNCCWYYLLSVRARSYLTVTRATTLRTIVSTVRSSPTIHHVGNIYNLCSFFRFSTGHHVVNQIPISSLQNGKLHPLPRFSNPPLCVVMSEMWWRDVAALQRSVWGLRAVPWEMFTVCWRLYISTCSTKVPGDWTTSSACGANVKVPGETITCWTCLIVHVGAGCPQFCSGLWGGTMVKNVNGDLSWMRLTLILFIKELHFKLI